MCVNIGEYNDKTLATLGLTEDQANICVNLSSWGDAESAGWTTGY